MKDDYAGAMPLYRLPTPIIESAVKNQGNIARVLRNIFGTPSSPQIFTEDLSKHLTDNGYKVARADRNVFFKHKGPSIIVMVVPIVTQCEAGLEGIL